ncbi:hypothetical protein ACWDE9_26310, partial [Streptomyces olivaceoviridis]
KGVLRAVAPLPVSSRRVAWLASAAGGREWTTSLGALSDPVPITPDTHPARHDVSCTVATLALVVVTGSLLSVLLLSVT